ncbi:MAG: hypothetical protein IAE77_04100 [Prosthecobacter sp.]|uniref:hypothetical protein n=1 Tax=Prosthecobacter sp. TaxID=1965333 RepID=UPI0019F0EA7F|nr:hypothetical protein [Prosthecobacter sp.]MBE2282627.1 hypothetical protein [Prosthecobacter sp.]
MIFLSRASFPVALASLAFCAVFIFFGCKAIKTGKVSSNGAEHFRDTSPMAFWAVTGIYFIGAFLSAIAAIMHMMDAL